MSATYAPRPETFSCQSCRLTLWPTIANDSAGGASVDILRLRGGTNGVDDLVVASAAAKIAEHRFSDFSVGWMGVLGQQRVRRDNLTRRAVAALKTAVLSKRQLERMQGSVAAEPLDGAHTPAIQRSRECEASADRFVVDQHRAGAAYADRAALFRAGEKQILAQHVDQQPRGVDLQLDWCVVDGKRDGLLHGTSATVRHANRAFTWYRPMPPTGQARARVSPWMASRRSWAANATWPTFGRRLA